MVRWPSIRAKSIASSPEGTAPPRPGRLRRVGRGIWRLSKWTFLACLLYALAVLVGLIPVNRDFQNVPQGIEVFVYADAAHSEIIVPRVTEVIDWSDWFEVDDFREVTGREACVVFGWGDREFFFETQTWDDAKASVVAGALLWPSETVMHVSLAPEPWEDEWYRRVVITPEQYARLVEHIQQTFVLEGPASPLLIADRGYGPADTFYAANGTYSLLYTCNNWTGDALKAAGVRTGWWTPFPAGLLQGTAPSVAPQAKTETTTGASHEDTSG